MRIIIRRCQHQTPSVRQVIAVFLGWLHCAKTVPQDLEEPSSMDWFCGGNLYRKP
jgi:hypothetical protein